MRVLGVGCWMLGVGLSQNGPTSPTSPTKKGEDSRLPLKLQELQKAAQGVEAMFVKDLLAAMRRGMPKNSLAEQGPGSEIYKDMLDQALAEKIGSTGAMGISKVLYDRLSQQLIKSAATPAGSTIPDISRPISGAPDKASSKEKP